MSLLRRRMMMNLAKWATITGNPVSFNAVAAKLRQLKIAFSPVQEGSGDPSPENERPIHGWTGVNVWQRGKNLLDPATKEQTSQTVARWSYANGFILRAGQTYTLSSDTSGVTVYITEKATDATIKTGETATYTPTQDTIVYFRAYLSSGIEDVNLQLELGSTASEYVPYDSDSAVYHVAFPAQGKNLLNPSVAKWKKWYLNNNKLGTLADDNLTVEYSVNGDEITVTTGSNHRGIGIELPAVDYARTFSQSDEVAGAIMLYTSYTAGETHTATNSKSVTLPAGQSGFVCARFEVAGTYTIKLQLEEGTSATTWEPFDGTIYSGWADPTTGDGMATGTLTEITTADAIHSAGTNPSGFLRIRYIGKGSQFVNHGDGLYNVGTVNTATNAYNYSRPNKAFIETDSLYIMPPATVTTKDEYLAWLAEVGTLQVFFSLNEPIPFHVDPQQINSLAGANTMWTDADTLTAEYKS